MTSPRQLPRRPGTETLDPYVPECGPSGEIDEAGLLDLSTNVNMFDEPWTGDPPTTRDPQGIHGAIWEEISGQEYTGPSDQPLTLAAYESGLTVRAYVEPVAVGSVLTEMPLFLEPGAHVLVPLESTYGRAFAAMPRRWRVVLEEA